MVGAGRVIFVAGLSDYFVHAYGKYAGSVIVIIATGENVSSEFLLLAAASMYSHLGLKCDSSLLEFISLVLIFVPILVLIWARQIQA